MKVIHVVPFILGSAAESLDNAICEYDLNCSNRQRTQPQVVTSSLKLLVTSVTADYITQCVINDNGSSSVSPS